MKVLRISLELSVLLMFVWLFCFALLITLHDETIGVLSNFTSLLLFISVASVTVSALNS